MKQDIAKKWVEALRSGEYKQGKGILRNDKNEFCCLGVLCDLAVKENIIGVKPLETYFGRYAYDDGDVAGISSKKVQEWSGLQTSLGHFNGVKSRALFVLNDGGMSFNDIADIIEANYEAL